MIATRISPKLEGSALVLPLSARELDLAQTLDCGQAFRWVQQEDGSYRGVVRGKLLHISRRGEQLLLHNTTLEDYRSLWQDYFDLERDYGQLKRDFSADPVMAQAMGYAPGIRVLRQEPWEALCTFILSANNNIPRIKGIVERLCALLGDRMEGDFYSFPPPDRLAALTEEELAPLRCGYRSKFLLDAARKVAQGVVPLEEAAALDTEAAKKMLMAINGVGPKVADCTLLFGLGHSECFPMDTWMKKVTTVLYPHGLPDCLSPHQGIAQQYLFHYARNHSELFL